MASEIFAVRYSARAAHRGWKHIELYEVYVCSSEDEYLCRSRAQSEIFFGGRERVREGGSYSYVSLRRNVKIDLTYVESGDSILEG